MPPARSAFSRGRGMRKITVGDVTFVVENEASYGTLIWARRQEARLKRAFAELKETLSEDSTPEELMSIAEKVDENRQSSFAVKIALHVHEVEGDLGSLTSLLKDTNWPGVEDIESRLDVIRKLPISVVAKLNAAVADNYPDPAEVGAAKK